MTVLTSPVCTIDAAGLHVPAMADVLAFWQAQYRSVYGADTYLDADCQDGQWVGLIAAGYNDINMAAAAVYNSFSPATAQGVGLSSVVKINGISRAVASYSTALVLIVGQAYTVINGGIVTDQGGNQWTLPATVTIPYAGQIAVTATCSTLGAVTAPAGTITGMFTPTAGWQSVNNPSDAAVGAPVQTDAQLRIQQSVSTMLPAQTGLDGLVGALLDLPGVTSVTPFENDTPIVDANGLPPHSLAMVIVGGQSAAIAQTMLLKKMSGGTTYGTTSVLLNDANGIPRTVSWFAPTPAPIAVVITLHAFAGFSVDVESTLQVAVANWVNGLASGSNVMASRLISAANAVGNSFEIVPNGIAIGVGGATPVAGDATMLFYQDPTCLPSQVSIVIAP